MTRVFGGPTVLVVVDMQRDFVYPSGALYVPGAEKIVSLIEGLRTTYDKVVFSRDWHPPAHDSFTSQGGPFPPHCVRGTPGADWALTPPHEGKDIIIGKGLEEISQGTDFSLFTKSAQDFVRAAGPPKNTRVDVVGVATEFCVLETALGAKNVGYETRVLLPACRPLGGETAELEAMAKLDAAGVQVVRKLSQHLDAISKQSGFAAEQSDSQLPGR